MDYIGIIISYFGYSIAKEQSAKKVCYLFTVIFQYFYAIFMQFYLWQCASQGKYLIFLMTFPSSSKEFLANSNEVCIELWLNNWINNYSSNFRIIKLWIAYSFLIKIAFSAIFSRNISANFSEWQALTITKGIFS